MDHVDAIVEQWGRERPDLDTSAMAVVARIFRLARLLDDATQPVFARHRLEPGWFDVLAALRRAGPPYELAPGELTKMLLLTSGGITKRLDRLEERGLIRRRPHPSDRRAVIVGLTAAGLRVVDAVVAEHVANEHRLLAALDGDKRHHLNQLLRELLVSLDRGDGLR